LAFDFFFVPPISRLPWRIRNTSHLPRDAGVGLLISTLAGRLSMQTDALRRRVGRIRMLYRLSRALSETPDPQALVQLAWKQLTEFYKLPILFFMLKEKRDARGGGDSAAFDLSRESMAATEWVMLRENPQGRDRHVGKPGRALLPLKGLKDPVGVLAIKPSDPCFSRTPSSISFWRPRGEIGGRSKHADVGRRRRAEADMRRRGCEIFS